jgi:type 1 glutamine amidotransferase
MKSLLLSACALLGLAAFSFTTTMAADPPAKIRVLLTYGGHSFDEKPFYALWDSLPGIVYTKAKMPEAADMLKPGLEKDFDVIVMYDQVKVITPEQQKAFVALLNRGIGLIAMHHNIGAHDNWDEYRNIIGGKFLHGEVKIGDKTFGPSHWRDDQEMDITVADRQHPITAGIDNFHVCDEAYRDCYHDPDGKVLLTTNHPQNDPPIAWVKQYGKSRVFYLQLGHGPSAWQQPAYPKLLTNGIRWVAEKPTEPKASATKTIDIAPVWAGHYVGFSLLTHGERQFVAFYDADRRMTVGSRTLGSTEWHLVRLPLPTDERATQSERRPATSVVWDSHNFITMAIDSDDQIHLSGNMHVAPLLYFRTTRPLDIDSFRWEPNMVGQRENRCTYPHFLTGPQKELLFTYRDGGSGNGDQIFNRYDLKTQTWSRLLDQPLFAGNGKMNAYFCGPTQDRNGLFHVGWVWRNTPDCATNHDLSYAQSKDLIHWTTSNGKPLTLPITAETAEVIDPVPVGGGIINSNVQLGFDAKDRPIVSYHKFDAQGNTQLYNARLEDGGWRIYQTSDWAYRWEFHGGGSIVGEIGLSSVACRPDGTLTQSYHHAKYGSKTWQLDEATLKPISGAALVDAGPSLPPELRKPQSTFPKMQVRIAADLGCVGQADSRYFLRWETLPPNRDRPYTGELPQPSMLQLVELKANPG